METFEEKVERIARAFFEQPCEDAPYCRPDMHDWDNANPGDKDYHRETVRFVLREASRASD